MSQSPTPDYLELAAEARLRITELSPDAVKDAILDGALVIDVREKAEFDTGHLPGAIQISIDILESQIHDIAPDLEQHIICYCFGGNRGAVATDMLSRVGYVHAASLQNGISNWAKARLPIFEERSTVDLVSS